MDKHAFIVEDEDCAMKTTRAVLECGGYRVSGVPDSTTGLARIKEMLANGGNIDVLLLDVGFPDLDAFDLVDALTSQGINIPTVFMTGFLTEDMMRAMEERGLKHMIQKPFTPQTLLSHVKAELNDPHDAAAKLHG